MMDILSPMQASAASNIEAPASDDMMICGGVYAIVRVAEKTVISDQ
jgi:hypothetical protein